MAFLPALSSPLVPDLADVPVSALFAVAGAVLGGLVHYFFNQYLPMPTAWTPTPPKGYTPGLRTLLQLGAWFAITALLSFSPIPFMTSFGLTMFAVVGMLTMWVWNVPLAPNSGIGLSADAMFLASNVIVYVHKAIN